MLTSSFSQALGPKIPRIITNIKVLQTQVEFLTRQKKRKGDLTGIILSPVVSPKIQANTPTRAAWPQRDFEGGPVPRASVWKHRLDNFKMNSLAPRLLCYSRTWQPCCS